MKRYLYSVFLLVIVISAFTGWIIASRQAVEPMKPLLSEGVKKYHQGEVEVYYVQWDEGIAGGRLVPVKRRLNSSEEPLAAAIKGLLAGTSDKEAEDGLLSSIPVGTRLLDFSIEGDVAYLDFNSEVEAGGGAAGISSRLAQITYTATAVKGIKAVRIAVDGRRKASFSGEGFPVDKPLRREDFPSRF